MKKILGILLVLAAAFTASAALETTVMDGSSSNQFTYVAAATTNTPLAVLNCVNSRYVALQALFQCTGDNSSNVTFRFDRSIDGINWHTNILAWAVPAQGAAPAAAITNLDVGAVPFLRVSAVENPGPAAVTNLLLRVFEKRSERH